MDNHTRTLAAAQYVASAAEVANGGQSLCVDLIYSCLLIAEMEGLDPFDLDAARGWLRANKFGEGAIIAFLPSALQRMREGRS